MGVASVGWAVTDPEYHLLRAKGKDLWGIREFDEAKTAAERRTKRISRRRRQRETARIGMLKLYFHDEIEKVDPEFFLRLSNSKYHLEDKDSQVRTPDGIFHDRDYHDKDYFKEYPTIFHLRKELIHNPAPHDVRLVYLALLNMFKHRGHFLNGGLSESSGAASMNDALLSLNNSLEEAGMELLPSGFEAAQVENILSSRELSRSRKSEELCILAGIDRKDKQHKSLIAMLRAVSGLKVKLTDLFGEGLEIGENSRKDFAFSDAGYEDYCEEIHLTTGDEYYDVICGMRTMYEVGLLADIMKGCEYLSDARVADYEKHARDLRQLKELLKRHHRFDDYNLLFRSDEKGSYAAYIGSYNSGKQQRRGFSERSKEALYKTIQKVLPEGDPDSDMIREEMERGTFLPKQLTADNGVIPNQVHAKEMRAVLTNAQQYLSFLLEKDEGGRTVSERILQLFSFQIPYYVGPLSPNAPNGWAVRIQPGAVMPWNLSEKIDLDKTSERFIENLVRSCSYLRGEKVLPKSSLLYQKYCVLNEINALSISGERISPELKQSIYHDLFETGRRVTRKKIEQYLERRGLIQEAEQLTGVDIQINNSLNSYGRFHEIFGDKLRQDRYLRAAEEIVFLCTVYGDSRALLKKRLSEEFSEYLPDEKTVNRIAGCRFHDWGRLSRELLELKGCDTSTGEEVSVIQAMWDNNLNLMELLNSDRFTFRQELDARQTAAGSTLSSISQEDLDEYYFSAPVKRMIWQTIQIIQELEHVLGRPPKRVFIEMARQDEEKGRRTDSRKKKLLDLYGAVKNDMPNWKELVEDADASGRLNSKKMYLYMTQMGRSMYTGDPIDLEQLFNGNRYDIDHIYPRHFVKDDNLNNNLVLVEKELNAHKSDTYPLEADIYTKQHTFWKTLADKGLITQEKYRRLTGRGAFTDEQKADFIARQMVETRQGTKGAADVIKSVLPETEIVYSKAGVVSDFRRDYDFLKSRIVNDFHHANDAYLNIVVGNVYYTKFTSNPRNFILKEYAKDAKEHEYHLSRMFDRDVMRGGLLAWKAPSKGDPGTLGTVRAVMNRYTPLMTRLSCEGHGAIANETLYSAAKAGKSVDNYIPLKSSDERMQAVEKYGGFTSASTAYFILVEHGEPGKRVRSLEAVPVYIADKTVRDHNALDIFLRSPNGLRLVDPVVRIRRIKLQTLIYINGYYAHMTGKTGKQITLRNAINLCVSQEWIGYIKRLETGLDKGYFHNLISKDRNTALYELLLEKHLNSIYAKRPNPIGHMLRNGRSAFEDLSLEGQAKALINILQQSGIGFPNSDLTSIGGSAHSGVMLTSKNISKNKEIKLINESVTGLYRQEIDLLTV